MRKRILIALTVSGVVFASVFGMAASLGVTTDSLSAGTADLGPCDTTGVSVAYDAAYSSTLPGYAVDDVTVSGVDNVGCLGQTLEFTLVDSTNTSIVSDSVVINSTDTSYSFSVAAGDFVAFSAANAENIHAIIHTP